MSFQRVGGLFGLLRGDGVAGDLAELLDELDGRDEAGLSAVAQGLEALAELLELRVARVLLEALDQASSRGAWRCGGPGC